MKKPLELPVNFVSRMKETLHEEYKLFESALHQEPPVSIRINPNKPLADFDAFPTVPWCPEGRYLPKRPSFVEDPSIFTGCYYVQEASSMFLSEVLRQHAPLNDAIKVLDLCAAPGGKSTLIASLLNDESFLVSNEIVSKRVQPLMENIARWGSPNTMVTNNNPQQFEVLKDFFDVIVVDAPCSGEGMFRKDLKAVQQWSEHLVTTCAIRQKNILESAIKCLKPGGLLVYSTCTFASQENEENITWLVEHSNLLPKKVEVEDSYNIKEVEVFNRQNTSTYYGYRFYPHRIQGEGFFMACLQKERSGYPTAKIKTNRKSPKVERIPSKYTPIFSPWMGKPEQYTLIQDGEQVAAIPSAIAPHYGLLHSHLRIRLAGVAMGKFKNKKFIPGHELAVSYVLNHSVASLELDYTSAMQYLRRKDFAIDLQGLSGWVAVKYKTHVLGWIKALPNRINNYYPMELRIRKDLDISATD